MHGMDKLKNKFSLFITSSAKILVMHYMLLYLHNRHQSVNCYVSHRSMEE